MTKQNVRGKLDPGTFSIILGTLDNIAKEMFLSIENSAWSYIVNTSRDFSTVIVDRNYELLSVPDETIPLQSLGAHSLVKNLCEHFAGDINEGDIFTSNLAYLGNTHMGEPSIVAPVFYDNEVLFYLVTRGHMIDMGAGEPSPLFPYAKDYYAEGLKIPPVKLYKKGKKNQEIFDVILANLRYTDFIHGDLMAHISAISVGKNRLMALIEKYGAEALKLYCDEVLNYTERMVKKEINKMKPGTYSAEDWLDTNAYGYKNIPVRAKLTIEKDRWVVDLSENIPQVIGSINASLNGCTLTAVNSALAFCINPGIPRNGGIHRNVEIICPPGTLLSATYPASTQSATSGAADLLISVLMKCIAQANPVISAAGPAGVHFNVYSGKDYRQGNNLDWAYLEIGHGGGSGGMEGIDGWSQFIEFGVAGGTRCSPIEMVEWRHPLIIEQWEVVTDHMGAGKWRGGPGVTMVTRTFECSDTALFVQQTGQNNVSYGLYGGKPGKGSVAWMHDPKEPGKRIFHTVSGGISLPSGWTESSLVSGGGGYGDPLDRDVEKVRDDVRDEIVSIESAEEEYGVVFHPNTYEIDISATEKLRSSKKESIKNPIETWIPKNPGTGANLRLEMMIENDSYIDLDRDPTQI